MSVTYSFDQDVLAITAEGIYQPKEVVRAFLDGLADPACPPHVHLLFDVSQSKSLATRPAEDIRMVAEFLGPYADRVRGRCAVVAPSDVKFGLSQIGAVTSLAVGIDTRVFRDAESARAWLQTEAAG
jgi:hypothetical protein